MVALVIASVLTAVASLVGSVAPVWGRVKERQAEVEAVKHEVRLEKIRSNENSWKDEFLIVVWSYPAISLFLPFEGLQQHTIEALKQIGVLPQWYIGAWVAISLSIFGVNKLVQIKK